MTAELSVHPADVGDVDVRGVPATLVDTLDQLAADPAPTTTARPRGKLHERHGATTTSSAAAQPIRQRTPLPPTEETQDGDYVIERTIPGAGDMTNQEWRDASAQSSKVIAELGSGIAWKHSYVAADKVSCVYEADGPELLRTHGGKGGFPVDAVVEVTPHHRPLDGRLR
jgi:hypothetical protein